MHLVIGTSGHIDHGKSTLVKALTGTDPDRFAEEKARGITIDLGFAHYIDRDGNNVSFIDVPGHEKFVHNMLAGAAGMDAVLMVIASDEGVMPQTLEHLHICDLLGVGQGVIALSRVDLVDEELLELCMDDVREQIAGTFLEEAPIIPVSTVTGQGLEQLKEELTRLTGRVASRNADHPFRFPVDRSFTLKGFGTVITGTVLAGRLNRSGEVLQYPQARPLRIRGMQVHGQGVEDIQCGQRAAINLIGLSKEEISRGDQLAAPGSLLSSYIINVELKLLKDSPRNLTQRTRIRMHLGTREAIGRIVLLEGDSLAPGETRLAQLRLETRIDSRYGDRFIIRNYSPMATLGGGRVIDPSPVKARRLRGVLAEKLRELSGGDEARLVEAVTFLQSTRGVRAREGYIRTGLSEKAFLRVMGQLSSQGQVILIDPAEKKYIHQATAERVGGFLVRVLRAHHEAHPERQGLTRMELGGKLAAIFTDKEVAALLARLVKAGVIEQDDQTYRLAGHQKSLSESQEELLERLVSIIAEGGVMPPRKTLLFEQAGVEEKTGLSTLKLGVHNGRLVRVKDDLYYTPESIAKIEDQLRGYLQEKERITVIEFKDLAAVTRGHAVALLEHFDTIRVTLRLDDHRVLR